MYTSAFSRLTKVGIEKRGKKRSSFFGYVTKHLNLRKNVVRDYIEKNIIDVEYVLTKDQRADILTKVLDTQRNKHLMSQLGLYRV